MNTEYVKGDCIFTRINTFPKQFPYLTKDLTCDVIIVGGGVTGSILSYYFSRQNIKTVLLEKTRIGHGSTSITTSLLQYELDSNASELKSYTTLEKVEQSYKLGLKAIDEIEQFIQNYGNHCDFHRVDSVLYTAKELETKEILSEYQFRKERGLDVSYLHEEENPFSFPLKSAVISKNGGAKLDPYRYTHQLLEVSCDKGLEVYENTEAIDITYHENTVDVHTLYGHKVTGKYVICATGYNTKLFTKRNFGVKMSTAFNVATTPIPDLEQLYHHYVFRDNKDPYNYFRTTDDNRIILGGEDINFQPDIEHADACRKRYEILTQRLASLLPQYPFEIAYTYCGAFASSKDNVGFIGPDPKHHKLWYCLGYGANGILFAILGGLMLSNLYQGIIDKDMELFKVDRFDGLS